MWQSDSRGKRASAAVASKRSKLRRRFARAFKYAEDPRVRDEMVCKEAAGLSPCKLLRVKKRMGGGG